MKKQTCALIFMQLFTAMAQTTMATLAAFHLVSNMVAQDMLSAIPEDRSKDARIVQPGSRCGKHPDPPEYIATYRT